MIKRLVDIGLYSSLGVSFTAVALGSLKVVVEGNVQSFEIAGTLAILWLGVAAVFGLIKEVGNS